MATDWAFRDMAVVFLHATASTVAAFAVRGCSAIGEIRRAIGTIKPFLKRGGDDIE